MKKLFFALALLFLTANGAFAATCDSNTDSSDLNGWCINNVGTLIPKVLGTLNSGGNQSVYYNYTPQNAPRSFAATESGMVLSDSGGVTSDTLTGFGSKFTLPRAAVGLTYTLSVGSKSTSTLDTIDTADTFLYSISGTGFQMGDSMKSTGQAGDSVTVVCTKAGQWTISQMHSAWTNNGVN